MKKATPIPCPNEANHTRHPNGYIAHSDWAADASLIATQSECEGCGRWEIWTPKRADLRIAEEWPPPSCDWGSCDEEGVAERFWPEVELSTTGEVRPGRWLPVCAKHTGVKERRSSPGKAPCVGCGRDYALTTAGLIRAHDHVWERCVGAGRAPGDGTS